MVMVIHERPVTRLLALQNAPIFLGLPDLTLTGSISQVLPINTTLHVARQYFICLCSMAAAWCETWAFPILMNEEYLANCYRSRKCKHNNCYIIAIQYASYNIMAAYIFRGCLWQPLYCFHFTILLYGFMLRKYIYTSIEACLRRAFLLRRSGNSASAMVVQ